VLEGVAAASANDIWAVGWTYDHNNNDVFRPLTLHWDGVCWSEVWCPTLGSEAQLFAVACLPQGDAFAVGQYFDPMLQFHQTFAIRWLAGFNVWQLWLPLNVPNSDNFLFGVSATSPNDIWAVGHTEDQSWQNLAQHWDGANWTIAPTPNVGGPQASNTLNAVVALGPDLVLAAGLGNGGTLIERWDGQQWSVVPSPNDPTTAMFGWNGLLGIAAEPTFVCSVGVYTPNQIPEEMLILQGDPFNFQISSHPFIPGAKPQDYHFLSGVGVDPAGSTWAVGVNATLDMNNAVVSHTLVIFRPAGFPFWILMQDQPNGSANELSGVAPISQNDVWAVGWYHAPNFKWPFCLLEHWDGQNWKSFP